MRRKFPDKKPHWRSIIVWKRTGDMLAPLVESTRLVALYRWRANKAPPDHWYTDPFCSRSLRDASDIDWTDFPELAASALAAATVDEPTPRKPSRRQIEKLPYSVHKSLGASVISCTYDLHWKWFTEWCERHACSALPASGDTIARYLANLAEEGLAKRTIGVAIAAITKAHVDAGHPRPRASHAVRETLARILKP